VLSRKRKETQEAIDRLENGLHKLHKTQARAGFGGVRFGLGWQQGTAERACRAAG
jgi:hypothetical protein